MGHYSNPFRRGGYFLSPGRWLDENNRTRSLPRHNQPPRLPLTWGVWKDSVLSVNFGVYNGPCGYSSTIWNTSSFSSTVSTVSESYFILYRLFDLRLAQSGDSFPAESEADFSLIVIWNL